MGAGLAARLLLAGVFGLAGLGKFLDRAGSRRALSDFGVPERLTRPAAVLLPAAELTVALALLPATSAHWGALGALALLAAFSAAVGVNLARGRKPDCHCFGQVHSTPIGGGTLLRNAGLGALSALVWWQPGPPAGEAWSWYAGLDTAERAGTAVLVVLVVLVVGEGWMVLNLMRQQGRLLLRLDALEARIGEVDLHPGLPVGSPAPSFSLPELSGRTVSLEDLLAAGPPVMLLFADPGCGPCNGLFPEIGRWQRAYRQSLTVVVISAGNQEANRAKAEEHHLGEVLLQTRREVADAYKTTATPSAVIVTPDRRVASPVVAGGDAIWKLLLRAPRTAGAGSNGTPALGHEIEIVQELEPHTAR